MAKSTSSRSDGATIVFVEVKARRTGEFGHAAEAVSPQKQRRLVSMAGDYLATASARDRPCRFDVVAMDGAEADPRVTLYRDAFGQ